MRLIFLFLFCTISIYSLPYTDNGDGTILDQKTNLVWQKCSQGQDEKTCEGEATQTNWMQANVYCGQLVLAGKKWRLPKREEILGLLDVSIKADSKIDPTAFPNTSAYRFWSSTVYDKNPSVMWTTHFYYGDEKRTKKTGKGYAKCVMNK